MAGSSWKVAYADFVTAMMAFFLLMWVLNMVPPETQKEMSVYFMDPGGYNSGAAVIDFSGPPPVEKMGDEENLTPEQLNLLAINRFLDETLQDELVSKKTSMATTEAGVLLRTSSALNFENNGVDLGAEGEKVLQAVVQVMQRFKVNLAISGHTDSAETGRPRLRDKWELSAARAASVTAYIVDRGGINPSMIRSSSYANFRPIVPDSAEEPNPVNRRVEFFFHTPDTRLSNGR
ncbi:MAG: flagellar motor protein MotB [Deltaproteobacteria bacterium]|jgi:chemotaxis protein MotB|nr:flagellar motor protein MotB [Deltaproteobacteria bacterium]